MFGGRLLRTPARRRLAARSLVALALLLAIWPLIMSRSGSPVDSADRPNIGFTFSRRQAEYLGLPWQDTFRAAMELRPTLVRLGAYWDEIERQPGRYDFTTLDWQLDQLPARTYQVVLTVGMKAPRWPEYYLPGWLQRDLDLPRNSRVSDDPVLRHRVLQFIARVVQHVGDRPNIAYWQVENEPLDPAGPRGWRIGEDFLGEEVGLVRSLDPRDRPIVINMFLDSPPVLAGLPPWQDYNEMRARAILGLADVLGLDLYPSRGIRLFGMNFYLNWSAWGWEKPALELRELAHAAGKDAWVIEAQAEPWEPARLVYTDAGASRSVGPDTATATFQRLRTAGFGTILLWGVEHWYMRRERHDDATWWDAMRPLFHAGPPPPGVGDVG